MKIIMSTDHCYEGYDKEEGGWEIGSISDLEKEDRIDNETISWCQHAWEDEKDYFAEFIEEEIKNKQAEVIVLGGRVGLWNGSPVGGKAYGTSRKDIVKTLEMDVDTIEVVVDKSNREITINGYHHDGTHSMNIYLVTKKELKQLGLYDDYEYEGVEGLNYPEVFGKIIDNLESLKLTKNNQYFGV